MLERSGAETFIITWVPTVSGYQTDAIGKGYQPDLDWFEVGPDKIVLANVVGLSDIDDVSIRLVSNTYRTLDTGNIVFTSCN